MPSPAELISRIADMAKLAKPFALADVSACVTEDNSAGTYATETTDANDVGANDVTMPDPFDSSDAIYFAYSQVFAGLLVNVGTAGVGDAVAAELAWEYWNGASWSSISSVTDGTTGFTVAGVSEVVFVPPTNWQTTTINSLGPYYWVRLRATANDVWNTTQPILTQVSIRTTTADRVLALSFLQEAVDIANDDARVYASAKTTVTLTASQAAYTLDSSPFPTDMVALGTVTLTDASVTAEPLVQVSMADIDQFSVGSQANGSPSYYAVDWPRFEVYPTPGSGASLTIRYTRDASVLTDATTDITTSTYIPRARVWDYVYEYAMGRAYEYKGDYTRSSKHFAVAAQGLKKLNRWKAESGGEQLPGVDRGVVRVVAPSQDTGF